MKPQNLQTLKGFRDFLPEEALKREWLNSKLRQIFKIWGYDPVETPTLEYLELFEGQIGDDEKLFYKFKDPGGRNVALRYDQTVPICRVVGQYSQKLTMPFRRYQIQPVFRAEKPQAGRYREFIHCDADIFGIKSPLADAELIALSLDIYRRLGFPKVKVLINDRQLLKDLPYKAIVTIDKLKKIGQENVIKEITERGIKKPQAEKYLKLVKNLKPNQTIKAILKYLKDYGFDQDWYEFDPTIARSFSYSSGPIWEVEIPGFKAGSVLGGERFDNIIKNLFGLDIPGTGFGLGFDRTLEAAEEFNLLPQKQTVSQILVAIFSPEALTYSTQTVASLRKAGLNTELYPKAAEQLNKQLKYANKKGIPWVIIIGPDEVENNQVTLKNMKTGEQESLTINKVITLLKKSK